MLCDICDSNEAVVHVTEMINDEVKELHLCEECAQEKGAQMEQQFSISDLLSGLVDFTSGKKGAPQPDIKLQCDNCKLTYEEFKKIGRLGCSECYNTFKVALEPLLKNIHGSTKHIGKTPHKKPGSVYKARTQVDNLRRKLERAVQLEEYEEAAKLRDLIRKIQEKQS